MAVNPAVVGVGVGVATAVAVGVGGAKLGDSIAAKHPTGSDADKPAGRIAGWSFGLGIVSALGGMAGLATGHATLGAGLLGAGFGSMLGGLGAQFAFTARHGVGVDSAVDSVLAGYDHDRSGQLELEDRGFWRQSETRRTERTSHTDSDGDTYYEHSTYSIDRLADRADTNDDWVATRPELRDVTASFDTDGDGRLKGDELARYEREVGEQRIDWYRSSF